MKFCKVNRVIAYLPSTLDMRIIEVTESAVLKVVEMDKVGPSTPNEMPGRQYSPLKTGLIQRFPGLVCHQAAPPGVTGPPIIPRIDEY